MFEWYTHLCEYHNVSPEEALKLGTRATGRRPNLPGSDTCKPVSGLNMEEIWALKKRETTQEVFDFYRDQGAWSTFRQCVRHKDLEGLHLGYINFLIENNFLKDNIHMCEYGCGVAPFMTTFLKYLPENSKGNLNISLCDVSCDHFDFAKFRLNRIKKDKGFDNINLNFEEVKVDKLPSFNERDLDVVFCFEVLEHVPSPVAVINNFKDRMKPGAIYIENFIKHEVEEDEDTGCDLESARKERDEYYTIVNEYYNLVHPTFEESEKNPSVTRIWQRNSL